MNTQKGIFHRMTVSKHKHNVVKSEAQANTTLKNELKDILAENEYVIERNAFNNEFLLSVDITQDEIDACEYI